MFNNICKKNCKTTRTLQELYENSCVLLFLAVASSLFNINLKSSLIFASIKVISSSKHAVLSCAPPSFYCECFTSLVAVTKAGSDDKIYDVTCSHELIESLLRNILERYCSVASTNSEYRNAPNEQ